MMKRRNGEIVVKRSSRYAKRPTKSYTGEHFLSSNYGTVLKMLTLFCLVLFGDYCLGNFRLEYIWPLWLCMNSLVDAYKMQGFGFAVFFIGIVITSDVICFLLVPVRWLFLVASSYVWLQYVISSERGLCIQTVVLWILFVYVESCIRVRELNRYLGPSSSSAMFFSPSPSVSLWPAGGGADGTPPSDSLTSQLLALNGTADTASGNVEQQHDLAVSAASSAVTSTLLRIETDVANDSSLLSSSSAASPWLLWTLITSATPGFFGSTLPLRLELCRPLAAHCTGYPIITLTRALKSFIAYRVKRSRQRQFAKENQQLKDLLFHALPDDVQQRQRSQLFSTFSLSSSSSLSSAAANSNSSTINSGYNSTQSMHQPSSVNLTQLTLSNGPGSTSTLPSNGVNAWPNSYSGGGLSDISNSNNLAAGLSYGDSLGLHVSGSNILRKSSSSSGFNSSGAPVGLSSPAHHQQRATYSGSYLSSHDSGIITTTPVSAYAGNSSTDAWNSWTPNYVNSTTSFDDGGSSVNKGGGSGVTSQLRGSSKAVTSSRGTSSKTQQRSLNSRSSAASGSNSKTSSSMNYNKSTNSKVQNDVNKLTTQQNGSVSESATFTDSSTAAATQQQRPKPQPQFAIIAKIFSALGSLLFSSSSSSSSNGNKSVSPSRRGSVTLPAEIEPVADAAHKSAAEPASNAGTKLKKNFDGFGNENIDEDDDGGFSAVDGRSRHAQHVRRRTAANSNNKSFSSTIAHSSRSSSNSQSSGGSFAETDRLYADDNLRRDPSLNAGSSDNELVAEDEGDDDDILVCHRIVSSSGANDKAYETAIVVDGGGAGDAVTQTDSRKSAAAEHAAPPTYESLVMGGAGDAGLTMMNDNKRDAASNKTNGGGRGRRRAMTASSPTVTSTSASDHTVEQLVAVEQPSTPPSQSASGSGNSAQRLELEHKRLKNDLMQSRQTEQDLRSQLSKMSIDQQSLRSDNVLLQKQNDSLQQRLHEMGSSRTREKKDAGAIEKKLAEETKKRTDAEKLLERERRAHAKDLEDSHKRESESDKMRAKLGECEQELLQLRQDLNAKEDEARKFVEENRRLEQYRSAQKDTDVLISALSAMQDKNMLMENSLTAETKLKLELFSALGDAKKDLDSYKTLVLKRDNEIKELKECVRRLSAQATVAPQQQQSKQQISAAPVMPTSSSSLSNSGSTRLADVLSNGFSSNLDRILSNGTGSHNKPNSMARLNSLSVLDHHKFGGGGGGMGDSLASTLGQHFGSNVVGGGGMSSVPGSSHLHQLHNHHQQTLNDALASFGSTSSSSPGFLHEYTSGGNSTPPLGSQGGNGVGVKGGGGGGLFGELGYGSHHHLNNNNYYAAAVQGGGSSANRSTPSPSSVPGSAAAAAALQGGGGNMHSSPSTNLNNDGSFSRW